MIVLIAHNALQITPSTFIHKLASNAAGHALIAAIQETIAQAVLKISQYTIKTINRNVLTQI